VQWWCFVFTTKLFQQTHLVLQLSIRSHTCYDGEIYWNDKALISCIESSGLRPSKLFVELVHSR
jgi:hypothetical protein